MNENENPTSMETMKKHARSILTTARLKKAGAVLIICAVAAGGGSWYHHQQKQTEHAQIAQARTNMIEAQAAQHNMSLLDTDQIRSIAAESIGIDEGSITYREIALMDTEAQHDDHKEKKEHHKEKKHETEAAVENTDTNTAAQPKIHKHPSTDDYNALAESQAVPEPSAPAFHPVYKVSCKASNVKYSLRIDAVTGQLLSSKIG